MCGRGPARRASIQCPAVCDTLVSLTDDGVLFAKNSDRDPNEPQILRWFAAADHADGGDVACTWIEIPQVPHTNAVVLSQPWWMWGAEIGANEHGVVIGNEAVYTTEAYGDPALLGMDLLRLGLERADTAERAAAVIVELLEAHGQGGSCSHERPWATYHNSFLIADRMGAIVLETAGRHWASETVTGRGRSISNGLTIAEFAARFANHVRGEEVACAVRRSRTQAAAIAAHGVTDLFAALRDHGSTGVVWEPERGSLAGPCAHAGGTLAATQTTASWVSDLRPGGVHWATATAAPCTSTFHPVRIDEPVELGPEPSNRFDPSVRWWRHELLHRLALRDLPASLASVASERDRLEAGWVAAPPSSAEAFANSDAIHTRWLAELTATAMPEARPGWLVDRWAAYDSGAHLV